MDKLTLPNLLSISRLLLALPSCVFVVQGNWLVAAVVLIAAVVTDVADGYVARARGQVSRLGGVLDHGSDALFVTLTLAGFAARGLVPVILPALIAAAFIQYILDSRALSGQQLRASRLGRYNGIAYFVLAGFPTMQHALGIYLLPDTVLTWFGWALVVTTAASMIDRLIALVRLRT